jgi:sugar phosphate isomerase/epimerase
MENFKLILFTKHFRSLSINELVETIKNVGAEGADLCVRPGYYVEPENIDKLQEVARIFKDEGLSIPMITTPTDFVEPDNPVVEKVFSGCREAEINIIKIGYWYMEKDGYWKTIEKIRKKIEKFLKLCEKYNVKILVHNHSGGTMGLNSSSVMNIVKGFNPKYIGVFLDPGHLSLVGEPLPMAVDIVKDYLSAVAVKDIIRERIFINGKRKWQMRIVPLGEGFVDWETLIKLLIEMKFDGPISIHSEYSEFDLETLIDQTKIDIRYFKKIINEVSKSSS